MAKQKRKTGFGDLPRQYNFSLNPYPDMRFSSCPSCHAKTGQRKLPLLIHINPNVLIALNYTNRYCKRCDLLIAHRDEIEHYLTEMFREADPEIVGNAYLIIGTVEKKTWQEAMKKARPANEIRAHVRDFKSYEELRMTQGGWFHEDQEPPVMEPPASEEWVKK